MTTTTIDVQDLHDAACALIELGVFELDEALRAVSRYDAVVPKADVINWLLDVRQTLDGYYTVRDAPEEKDSG